MDEDDYLLHFERHKVLYLLSLHNSFREFLHSFILILRIISVCGIFTCITAGLSNINKQFKLGVFLPFYVPKRML